MNNNLSETFSKKYREIIDKFFSRNPDYWPIFNDKHIQKAFKYRVDKNIPKPGEFPNLDKIEQQLDFNKKMAEIGGDMNDILHDIVCSSKSWEHPSSVENVVTSPSDPAIYGYTMGLISNANMVYEEYAGYTSKLEYLFISQIAKLSGFDPNIVSGIFTQGGTFCNLYGYLVGIRKSIPYSGSHGLAGGHLDYRIINSLGGHYSNITNLALLGIDIRDKTIRVQVNKDNAMDINNLEQKMRSCFETKCVIPTIMLTMGTTDTFAIDNVKSIYDLREKLCQEYNIEVKPHIHVDSAIAWPLIFFFEYDFEKNELGINQDTLDGLKKNVDLFRNIKYADSFILDFQKWGFVPLSSSLIIFKDKKDLSYLSNQKELFTYFESTDKLERYHYTIECSRGSGGLFGAYASVHYMGLEGYQVAIAYGLQNADYLREKLNSLSFVKVAAYDNKGPSVCFRLYKKNIDAEKEYNYELDIKETPEYDDRVKSNSDYHRQLFLKRNKYALFTNWVKSISHTHFKDNDECQFIPGEKVVFLNLRTTTEDIDKFVNYIVEN